MLSARLNVQSRLSQIQVKPARLNFQIQSVSPIQGSQISVSGHQFAISKASPSEISISYRAIQSELGFVRSQEFASKASKKAQQSAQSGIAKTVSEGYQFLNNPTKASTNIAKSVGTYNVNLQIAALPKSRPEVQVTQPGKVETEYEDGEVQVESTSEVILEADYESPQTSLDEKPAVKITVERFAPPKLSVDLLA